MGRGVRDEEAPMNSIEGRTYVVTGAASGIGAATAAALAAAGADVFAADLAWHDSDREPEPEAELGAARVHRVVLDVSDARQWARLAERIGAADGAPGL